MWNFYFHVLRISLKVVPVCVKLPPYDFLCVKFQSKSMLNSYIFSFYWLCLNTYYRNPFIGGFLITMSNWKVKRFSMSQNTVLDSKLYKWLTSSCAYVVTKSVFVYLSVRIPIYLAHSTTQTQTHFFNFTLFNFLLGSLVFSIKMDCF